MSKKIRSAAQIAESRTSAGTPWMPWAGSAFFSADKPFGDTGMRKMEIAASLKKRSEPPFQHISKGIAPGIHCPGILQARVNIPVGSDGRHTVQSGADRAGIPVCAGIAAYPFQAVTPGTGAKCNSLPECQLREEPALGVPGCFRENDLIILIPGKRSIGNVGSPPGRRRGGDDPDPRHTDSGKQFQAWPDG